MMVPTPDGLDLTSLLSSVEGRRSFGRRLLRNLRTSGLDEEVETLEKAISTDTVEGQSERAIRHFLDVICRNLEPTHALASLFGKDLESVEFIWKSGSTLDGESSDPDPVWAPLLEKALATEEPVFECVDGSARGGDFDKVEEKRLGSKVAVPVVAGGSTVGALAIGYLPGKEFSLAEARLLKAAAFVLGQTISEISGERESRGVLYAMIQSLAAALDARDAYTRGHSDRVAMYAMALVNELEEVTRYDLPEGFRDQLRLAALLHDIGKIGIRDDILLKPRKLTDEEYAIIKRHPVLGAEIVKASGTLDHVIPGVLYHHERFNGSGYPLGLRGEEIPLIARIIGLADTFDAMTTDRTFRPGMSHDQAIENLLGCAGEFFEPELVELLNRAYRKGVLATVRVAIAGEEETSLEEEASRIEDAHPGLADGIPPLPAVVTRLNEIMRDPECCCGDVARVLSTDEALVARVLKFANSAFYALSSRISTVPLAVTILGMSTLRNLVFGATLSDLTKSFSGSREEAESLWSHGVDVAAWCRAVAAKTGGIDREEAFTAGLLHDIGKGFILIDLPSERERVRKILLSGEDARAIEKETVGFDHAQLGGWAASRWRLPAPLVQATRWHHEPAGAAGQDPAVERLVWIVHIADLLARQGDVAGSDLAASLARNADPHVLKHLPVKRESDLEDLRAVVATEKELARQLLTSASQEPAGVR